MTKLSDEVKKLEDERNELRENLKEARIRLQQERNKAKGNILLVRHDGFERPYYIEPRGGYFDPFGMGGLPRHYQSFEYGRPNPFANDACEANVGTITFCLTGKKDPFGRVIYKEV